MVKTAVKFIFVCAFSIFGLSGYGVSFAGNLPEDSKDISKNAVEEVSKDKDVSPPPKNTKKLEATSCFDHLAKDKKSDNAEKPDDTKN